jgi:acyl-homoserine-lactone acylase
MNADGEMEQRDIVKEDVTIDLPGSTTHTGAIYVSHFGPMLAPLFFLENRLIAQGVLNNIEKPSKSRLH